MFKWAIRRKMVSENPFADMDFRAAVNRRERRITPEQEKKLLNVNSLDAPPQSRLVKVTTELLADIRRRADAGELQKDIAAIPGCRVRSSARLSTDTCEPECTKGSIGPEMKRRLIAGLDSGLRAGEMLLLQVKHVDYERRDINLPSAITKAKRDQQLPVGSERFKQVLTARRSLGLDVYLFGREDGGYVGSFDKSWKRLFKLAGLPVG